MDIKIGHGLGPILFGKSQSDILELLGEPDKNFEDDYQDLNWVYFKGQINLKFEAENDDRLSWIECQSPQTSLFDKACIGLLQTDVVKHIDGKVLGEVEIQDFGSHESHLYADDWLELQFDMGHLSAISFGVLYDDEDEPQWP